MTQNDSMVQVKEDVKFMQAALEASKTSTCLHRHVGAILVKDGEIIGMGSNRVPDGIPACQKCLRTESGKDHGLCMALHAEQQALIEAALAEESPEGATLYLTHQPCSICAKMLINAKVKRVLYTSEYPDQLAIELLKRARIEIA